MPVSPPPTSAQLGKAIRVLREKRGASIEALANAAGIHSTYLSGIERGHANPTWDILCRLAVALEIDPTEVIRLAGDQPSSAPKA